MKLGFRHKQAARMYVLGYPEKEIAKQLADSLFNVKRWRMDPQFVAFMRHIEETLDEIVLDLVGQIKREAIDRLHRMMQSDDREEWKWAIDRTFQIDERQRAQGQAVQPGQGLTINNYIESPEAKEHAKRYLELTRNGGKRAGVPGEKVAEA